MALGLGEIAILSAILQGAGGAIGGAQAASASGAGTAEQARQFDILRAERERRRREGLPLRDRLNYLFQQRLGMPQEFASYQEFNPNYGSGVAPQPMQDRSKWNEILAGYQPGMGGLLGQGGGTDMGSVTSDLRTSDLKNAQEQLAQQHLPPYIERMIQKALVRSKGQDYSNPYGG